MTDNREYQKQKIANESPDCRQERIAHQCEYQKERNANESSECREKRLADKREYRKEKIANATIADEIRKFHAAVSRGPLYICCCCDQLWYKHSVYNAGKLRLSNPNVVKYLLSKTSVDDIEWVCLMQLKME